MAKLKMTGRNRVTLVALRKVRKREVKELLASRVKESASRASHSRKPAEEAPPKGGVPSAGRIAGMRHWCRCPSFARSGSAGQVGPLFVSKEVTGDNYAREWPREQKRERLVVWTFRWNGV